MKNLWMLGGALFLFGCASSEVTTTIESSEAQIENYAQVVVVDTDPILSLPDEEQMPALISVGEAKLPAPVQLPASVTPKGQYSIQVLALSHADGFAEYVTSLPNGTPVYLNQRMVNGAPWYTLLYGDFETREQARQAMNKLPHSVKQHGPFIRDISTVKASDSDKLQVIR